MWQYAQCVCWELFNPITPSVSSMWFLLSSTYMLYFLVFLFFVMISLIGNIIVRVLSYSVDRRPLRFLLIVHYLYMSCGASTKTIYVFWRLWSMGFKLLENYNLIALSKTPIYTSTSDVEPGKACTCKPVVKKISSQDDTPCQLVFGTTFTGTTFLETGAWNLVC